jgi:hypothetical protein
MRRCFSTPPAAHAAADRLNWAPPARVVAAVMVIMLSGCSKAPPRLATQPVEGQVLWNGKPLEGAQVVFYAQGELDASVRSPRARTGPDGRFHIGTYDKADGAPEGQYAVTVVRFPMVQKGSDSVPGPNALPRKYANPKTTDLRLQIVKGANSLPPLELFGQGDGREDFKRGTAQGGKKS